MAEHLYGEEWDTDEFQTALKVVLKCEIQSLLERLSETGEETVLLTASTSDLCVGHLASSKALRFVNTADIGVVKNKFLNFLTGGATQPQPQGARQVASVPGNNAAVNKGKASQISNVVCNNLASKGTVQSSNPEISVKTASVKPLAQSQSKPAEKRPLETGTASQEFTSQSLDNKRRKTEPQTPLVKGNVMNSLQTVPSSSALVTQAATPTVNKGPAPKLKTTKVVSKSGGFTEERFSDAEFQKFLAQYKPNIPEGDDDDDDSAKDFAALLQTAGLPQMGQLKPFQHSPVSSVQNTQNKVASVVNSSADKNVKTLNNQSKQSSELKKDISSIKSDNKSVNKENRENVNTSNLTVVTEIKEEIDPEDLEFTEAQTSVKKDSEQKFDIEKDKTGSVAGCTQKKDAVGQSDKSGISSQKGKRHESIDTLDTEALIRMTKAKHLENMSEADREIQAKLGQLSSKLSWVVEYPKEKGQQEPSGQGVSGVRLPHPVASSAAHMPGAVHPHIYQDSPDDDDDDDLEEMDDEEYMDDEDFDEEDLDEEDKAALKAMREARWRKLAAANMAGFGEEGDMFAEGVEVAQRFHFPEDYEEEEDFEGFEDYNSEDEIPVNLEHLRDNRIHGSLPNLSGPNLAQSHGEVSAVSGHQPYQRTASPTSENFLMIGPIMAKCLICNKIVRKTEMKPHHETHLNEEPFDEEEGEEEEDLEGMNEDDGSTFPADQEQSLQGEYRQEEEYPHEEGEFAGEEGEYSEDYEFQADDTDEGLEFTAEKFVAEKLVAEKIEHVSDKSKTNKVTTCDICNKSFKSHGNMMRHRKNIHKDETKDIKDESLNNPCPVCGKTFRYVQKHIKKMHPDYSESVSGDISESAHDSLNCNICGEQFTEEDKLKEHFKLHA